MAETSPQKLLQQGDRDGAKQAAEKALQKKKNDTEALATLAKLAMEAGDVGEAERLISLVIPKDREDYDIGLVEAMLLAQGGNAQGAQLKYADLIGKKPARPEAHFGLGFLLLGKDMVKDAVGPLEKAVKADGTNWAYHFYLGLALGAQGKVKSALIELKAAVEQNPEHPPIYVALGETLASLGLMEEAETLYREGLKILEDEVPLLLGLANVLVARNKLEDALAAAKRAVEVDPGDAAALTELARLLLAHGLFAEALAVCEDTDKRGLATANTFMVKAMALESRDEPDLKGAAAAYRKAMDLDPTSWSLPNNLGLLLIELSEKDKSLTVEAQDVLEKAVARGGGRVEPKLNLAILLGREGQKAKAKELARQVAEHAEDPDYREQAAKLLKSLG